MERSKFTLITAEECEEWLVELKRLRDFAMFRKEHWTENMYSACILLINAQLELLLRMNEKDLNHKGNK